MFAPLTLPGGGTATLRCGMAHGIAYHSRLLATKVGDLHWHA
jgi:hypothetical protein